MAVYDPEVQYESCIVFPVNFIVSAARYGQFRAMLIKELLKKYDMIDYQAVTRSAEDLEDRITLSDSDFITFALHDNTVVLKARSGDYRMIGVLTEFLRNTCLNYLSGVS